MSLTIGSLCTGYGGLDAAVAQHWNARTVWLSEVDKNANQILAHHYPDVPNLGDLTVIDWDTVPTVDILTAGYPCQPFSQAGKRKGTADVRHLWPHIARAVDVLRPRICVFENVQGHLSKGGVEVVGSLTSMGYSVRWGLVRASDAGAPHRRARVFIVAVDRDTDSELGERWGSQVTHVRPGVKESEAAEPSGTDRLAADTGSQRHGPGEDTRTVGRLDGADESEARERERSREEPGHRSATVDFGPYEAAIRRWESVLGRPTPEPTVPTGRNGGHRLNPRFVEHMMGLPEGWVTSTGISHVAQLKALGNGVVPQQALLALQHLTNGDH